MLRLEASVMNWTDEAAATCVLGCPLVCWGIQSNAEDRIDINTEGEMRSMLPYIITDSVLHSEFAEF